MTEAARSVRRDEMNPMGGIRSALPSWRVACTEIGMMKRVRLLGVVVLADEK